MIRLRYVLYETDAAALVGDSEQTDLHFGMLQLLSLLSQSPVNRPDYNPPASKTPAIIGKKIIQLPARPRWPCWNACSRVGWGNMPARPYVAAEPINWKEVLRDPNFAVDENLGSIDSDVVRRAVCRVPHAFQSDAETSSTATVTSGGAITFAAPAPAIHSHETEIGGGAQADHDILRKALCRLYVPQPLPTLTDASDNVRGQPVSVGASGALHSPQQAWDIWYGAVSTKFHL
jgi:hypothetical protein